MNVTRTFIASLLVTALGVSYVQPALCSLARHDVNRSAGPVMAHAVASMSPLHHEGTLGCHDMATCGIAVVAALSDDTQDVPTLPTQVERRMSAQQRADQNPHSSLSPPPKL